MKPGVLMNPKTFRLGGVAAAAAVLACTSLGAQTLGEIGRAHV